MLIHSHSCSCTVPSMHFAVCFSEFICGFVVDTLLRCPRKLVVGSTYVQYYQVEIFYQLCRSILDFFFFMNCAYPLLRKSFPICVDRWVIRPANTSRILGLLLVPPLCRWQPKNCSNGSWQPKHCSNGSWQKLLLKRSTSVPWILDGRTRILPIQWKTKLCVSDNSNDWSWYAISTIIYSFTSHS